MTLIDDLEQTYLSLSHLAAGFTFSINMLVSDLEAPRTKKFYFLVKKSNSNMFALNRSVLTYEDYCRFIATDHTI